MTGRITLVGAGELMSAMSSLHRVALQRLGGPAKPVFLDTAAGFETNVDAIVEKAVEYYAHHLQTDLKVARFRHRERAAPADTAAAVSAIRDANLIFAGPGSPTYAIRQWRESPVWDAVVQRFQAGADILFASAASISLGRYSLPVYEIYKAGEDPFWMDGLNLLGEFGLDLAVVPHYDDNSGGENYDSRFCYMGARRFDILQSCLPGDVAILGIDAYTAICFDPNTREATVSGQGGVTVIGEGGSQRFESGSTVPFEAFKSSAREVVQTFDPSAQVAGYEFADTEAEGEGALAELTTAISNNTSMTGNEKVDLLAKLQSLGDIGGGSSETEDQLVDLGAGAAPGPAGGEALRPGRQGARCPPGVGLRDSGSPRRRPLVAPVMPADRRVRAGDIEIAIREWNGAGQDIVLVHGLASNARTWDLVAQGLSAAGHHVVSIDQRGHGQSDKPDTGYGFEDVTADLAAVIDAMGLEFPIIAGQSWGGNVVVDFAARYPGMLSGLVLVDGGLIDLSQRPGATWETIAVDLKPPNLIGTRALRDGIEVPDLPPVLERSPDRDADGQLRDAGGRHDPALADLDRHMQILWALWNHRPTEIVESLETPMLIAIADSGPPERRLTRVEEAERLRAARPDSVRWRQFEGAAHDIHVDQPEELAQWMLSAVQDGFFG